MDRYPYDKYTILLWATRALAHLGTHFTHRVIGLSVMHIGKRVNAKVRNYDFRDLDN